MGATDPISVVRDNFDAWTAGDWERFRASTAADVVSIEPSSGREVHGADEAVALASGWKGAFPDGNAEITNIFASGDQVCAELTYTGTNTGEMSGPMGTMPATGRRATLRACAVARVQDGKITSFTNYFD